MKTQKFSMSQYLPRPRERIFSFFEKAENLALITPRWLGFQVLSTSPVEIYEGRLIDYRKSIFADMFGNTVAADPDQTKSPDLTIQRETESCA